MALNIDKGLFTSDFIDCHAVLGVPIDSDPKEIRKRYLKIARTLHPDSFASANEGDKQRATELFSKMVIPANEKLGQDRERAEYAVVLRMKGQQVLRQQSSTTVTSEAAKQLSAASDFEQSYKAAVQQLAEQQYASLDSVLEITGQISELNLVYLLRKTAADPSSTSQSSSASTSSAATATATAGSASSASMSTASAAPSGNVSKATLVDQYYRRAEGLIQSSSLSQAILQLREALKIDPNSSRCHSLLGFIYFKQNMAKMARISFDRALELDPTNEMALKGKAQIEKGAAGAAAKGTPQKGNQADNKQGKSGGGFFGLFGGKKK